MNREFLPASGEPRQDLVLLHGWGANREVWRPLLASLRPWANVTLLDIPGSAPGEAGGGTPPLAEILQHSPRRAVYLGWSLGGQLALELAARHPARVAAVVTLCSNPCFVATDDWPGMCATDLQQFSDGLSTDPVAVLRRFDSLQVAGAVRPRPLLRQLQGLRSTAPGQELQAGLDWLANLDQRQLPGGLSQPQLHLQAASDALVPAGLTSRLQQQLAAPSRVEVLDGSHTMPLEQPGLLAHHLQDFLEEVGLLQAQRSPPTQLDKGEVAASFSRAAASYDSVAQLQRDVGCRLLQYLDELSASPATIVDLGCGTGHFQPLLQQRFPAARYIGLDLAEGMVRYARRQQPGDSEWIVGDAESLPLASASVDLVFSSLAIQWCERPDSLFAELARVLRPGGQCVFTTLGPATLQELRAAWAAVDGHQHVNSFLPAARLEAAAGRAAGVHLNLAGEQFCMRYTRVRDLLDELKGLGAHNVTRQRPSGLTGRGALQGMLRAYEDWRQDGMLPATYDVLFGTLERT